MSISMANVGLFLHGGQALARSSWTVLMNSFRNDGLAAHLTSKKSGGKR
jgi:hypothetical protein